MHLQYFFLATYLEGKIKKNGESGGKGYVC